jgi:[ribosomal protein S5]-alanine N-acetyltransferase
MLNSSHQALLPDEIQTERLVLRQLRPQDAPFILKLLNEPDWERFIGKNKVKTLVDAQIYIETGPMEMYLRLGFGLYLVAHKTTAVSLGLCGLIKRDGLADPDLGFAFLAAHRGQGYAYESAQAMLSYAQNEKGLSRLAAITDPQNTASIRLLQKLGMRFEKQICLKDTGPLLDLFGLDFATASKSEAFEK